MSKISSYGTVSPPTAGDLVIGTNTSDSNKTKNFRVEDIAALAATSTLSEVLTAGNTASNNLTLIGTLSITGTSVFNGSTQFGPTGTTDFTHLVEFDEVTLEGTVEDGFSSVGTAGQVLSSTAAGVQWIDEAGFTLKMTAGDFTTQTPSGLDAELQVLFGAAQSNASFTLDVAGLVTFLEAGDYRISVTACLQRNTSADYAQTQIAIFYNSAGGAPTQAASIIKTISNTGDLMPHMYSEDFIFPVIVGSTLVVKMLNDDDGLGSDNNTSLIQYGGSLGTTPSASLAIYKD
jgi:hypothetical protein